MSATPTRPLAHAPALALVLAGANVGASLTDHPAGVVAASDLALPFAATLAVALVASAAALAVPRRALRGALVGALAAGALAAPVLESLLDAVPATRRAGLLALGVLAVGLAAALGARACSGACEKGGRRLAAASPFVAAALLALCWQVASGGALGALAVALLLAVVAGLVAPRVPAAGVAWLGVALGLAWPLVAGSGRAAAEPGTEVTGGPRRVVLLTIDTLRADRLGAFGSRAALTPRLDALCDESVVFEEARAPAPWTKPSFASLFTGLPPLVHGVVRKGSRLPRVETIAERLRTRGYRTAGIGHNVFLESRFGFDRGFDEYRFPARGSLGSSVGARVVRALAPGHHPAGDEPSTATITDEALAWLDANADERFFLWVHWFDPHLPYAPPADFAPRGDPPRRIGRSFDDPTSVRAGYLVPDRAERDWIAALYDAELALVDREVGRFLDALRASPHWADTLLVFASDHGEELFEHGGFEHGHTVHEEVLRVPLAIRLPGTTGGARVAGAASLEDVPATIADLVGDADGFRGRSLRPRWEDGAPADEAFCATGTFYYTDRAAVIRGGLKYVLDLESGEERLYDLATDPGETRSLARERPDDVEAARRWLREHEAASQAERERLGIRDEAADVDSSVLRALEKVGYVGGD